MMKHFKNVYKCLIKILKKNKIFKAKIKGKIKDQ